MNLVHPSFLWALLFLAIPIIVHLFNLRRYKKEYFSNITLLKTILNDTQKISQLKKRLLLTTRLLAMLFAVLGFVQPFFNSDKGGKGAGQPIISIYIDNSFSMESPSGVLKAIDDAKEKALEIIQTTQSNGLYQIISNDFKGNQLQLIPYSEAVDAIKRIEVSSTTRLSEDVWQKQLKTTSSNPSERKLFYWISDFQKNQFSNISHSEYPLTCIPITHSSLKNIYIDTAYIYSPSIKLNQDIQIIYRVRKSKDDQSEKSLITLQLNQAVKNRREISWRDVDVLTDTFSLKITQTNWQHLKLSVSDPSISFDNDYYFSFYVSPKPYITLVSSGADQKFIINALKADDNFEVHSFQNLTLNPSEVQNSNLIVLNQVSDISDFNKLNEWLKGNKSIAIILPADLHINLYNKAFVGMDLQPISQVVQNDARIKQFNLQDALFKDIFSEIGKINDFPSFQSYFLLGGYSKRVKEVLISLDNGLPFLIRYSRLGEGSIYLFTAPFQSSKSDFVYSSVFAPLMYKLGAASSSYQINSYVLGNDAIISIPVENSSQDKIFKLTGENTKVIPPQRKIGNSLNCSLNDAINQSGIYHLEDERGKSIYELAVNHNRRESLMDFLNSSDIKSVLGYEKLDVESANYLKHTKLLSGLNLWKLWIAFAILFLLLEMLIILFWDKFYTKFKTSNK